MTEPTLSEEEQQKARKDREEMINKNPDSPFAKKIEEMHPDDKIKTRASEILEKEDSLSYLIKTVGKIHKGDEHIISKLIISGLSSGFDKRKYVLHSKDVGSTSKGKSSVHEHVASIFNNVIWLDSSSAKAMFYKAKEEKLPNKSILIFNEAGTKEEEGKVLERALTDDTSHSPTHATVIEKKYHELKVNQIVSVWKNQATLDTDEQLNGRYLISNVNETKEQDNLVFESQRDIFLDDEIEIKPEEDFDFKVAKEITNKIKKETIKIKVPYKDFIESSNKDNRRTNPKFFKILRTVIYLNRFQRPIINECVIGTKADFEIAQIIWNRNNKLELVKLDSKALETLNALPNENEAISIEDLGKRISIERTSVYSRLNPLRENGWIAWKRDINDTRRKLYYRTVESVEDVSISVNWQDFKVESLYLTFNESVDENKNKINLDNLYSKIINSSIPEKLSTLLKKDDIRLIGNKDEEIGDSILPRQIQEEETKITYEDVRNQ